MEGFYRAGMARGSARRRRGPPSIYRLRLQSVSFAEEEAMITKVGDTYSIEVEIEASAPIEEAWFCFLDPKKRAEFFWGISFASELLVGGPITWSGVWEGKPFMDKG